MEARRDPWAPLQDDGSGSDNEDIDYDALSVEQSSEMLAEYIVNLKLGGSLNATQACTLSFWCVKSGVRGPVEDIAVPPLAHSFVASSAPAGKSSGGKRTTNNAIAL